MTPLGQHTYPPTWATIVYAYVYSYIGELQVGDEHRELRRTVRVWWLL